MVLLNKSEQPLRLSEITEGLAVKAPTASDAVNVLVTKGLVAKSRSPEDKRAIALSLTQKGKKEANDVASWPDFLLTAMDGLNEEEERILHRSLIKMIKALSDQGKIPVAKMCVSCQYFKPNAYPNSDKPHHCNLMDSPLGDRQLRLDCPEHIAADKEIAAEAWDSYTHTATTDDM